MRPLRITPVLTGVAAIGTLLLAACNAEPERSADDTRDARGEVLEGTISDEMIQFDQLRSQGVPAEVEAEDGADVADAAAPTGDAEPAEEPAQTEPAAAE